jgi:hypothetical protein
MTLLEPWYEVTDAALVAELHRELAPGHLLYGKNVTVLARRRDRDDVLFELCDGTRRLAQVHLTYATESDPAWPSTQLFDSRAAWAESMRADKAAYDA